MAIQNPHPREGADDWEKEQRGRQMLNHQWQLRQMMRKARKSLLPPFWSVEYEGKVSRSSHLMFLTFW
jgi:site-specific recombinase